MANQEPTQSSNEPLSAERRVDLLCDLFEAEWVAGSRPRLEAFLDEVGDSREVAELALRELLAIERHYRQRAPHGNPESDQQVLADHPELANRLAPLLEQFRGEERVTEVDPIAAASDVQLAETSLAKAPTCAAPAGLRIRCPHCSHPVELVAESPHEEVTCGSCGSAFSLASKHAEKSRADTLKHLGRFDLISKLGSGGFGTVWRARDRELDRIVAVKTPRGQMGARELEYFYREARAAAQLRHPNIVTVHEVGSDSGVLFIVSDIIEGASLADWMADAKPTPREVAEMMSVTADALHYAHEMGVVHRDLKPSNILVDRDNRPHVMDFGLAKREAGEVTMTVEGQVLGTPAYMSPEQAAGRGHWTDRRSDLYSLGVVIYEMLTGELPFRGAMPMQIHQKLTAEVADPRKLNRHVPADMATLCLKCLELDPNRRYPDARTLADELRRFLDGRPLLARPLSRPARLIRWARRNPLAAVAVTLGVVLAIGGPSAALMIEGYRQDLAERYRERDALATDQQADLASQAQKNAQLAEELAAFKSTNPTRAAMGVDWRAALVKDILDKHADTLARHIAEQPPDSVSRIRAELGLASLLVSAGRAEEAIGHYESALASLRRLFDQSPGTGPYRLALAECCMTLGDLLAESDVERSRQLFAEAKDLMVDSNAAVVRVEIDRAAVQWRLADGQTLTGDDARAALAYRDRVAEALLKNPSELFDLAEELSLARFGLQELEPEARQ